MSVVPLALLAAGLASGPWLRAFPASVLAVPLFGAAALSVLVPLIVVGIGVRRLWLTALIDLVLVVFYELLVPLRSPTGVSALWDGLAHGPARILSYALPLVGPRTLLVVPVALCWLCGAVIGECVARAWHTVVPYAAALLTFGLAYAATARAIGVSAHPRRWDTLLAGALLLVLLLLRAAQTWVVQGSGVRTSDADGVLSGRGIGIGAVLAAVVAVGAAGIVQDGAFSGAAHGLDRSPPINQSTPLAPIAFVAGLRPDDPRAVGQPLFQLTVDSPTSNYVAIASLDDYDGESWTFDRTFSPSGGVIPAEPNPGLRTTRQVTQVYTIVSNALTGSPWMPFLYRPREVSGIPIDTDADSGMIVPQRALRLKDSYTVRSTASDTSFATLAADAVVGQSTADTTVSANATVASALPTLVASLQDEASSRSTADRIGFLQSVAAEFQHDSLTGGRGAAATAPTATPTPSSGRRSGSPTASAPASTPADDGSTGAATRTGSTAFADVLASIRQFRTATPEQYATLMCLIARQIGVPARVVTGFRIPLTHGATALTGKRTVTSGDAWTWVEVPIQGKGWVVLDPSPSAYGTANQEPVGSVAASASSSSPLATTTLGVSAGASSGPHAASPGRPARHRVDTVSVLTIVLIVVVVVVLLLLAAIAARKPMRARRRRRAQTARTQIAGAWQEGLDRLTESGIGDLEALTGREITTLAATRFGADVADRVHTLARAADRAVFDPRTECTPGDASAAWAAVGGLRSALGKVQTPRARLAGAARYVRSPRPRDHAH